MKHAQTSGKVVWRRRGKSIRVGWTSTAKSMVSRKNGKIINIGSI